MLVERKVTWLEFVEAAREFQPQLRLSRMEEGKITNHLLRTHPTCTFLLFNGRPGLIRQIHSFYFKELPYVYTTREDQTYCGNSLSAESRPSHGIRYIQGFLSHLSVK